MEADYTCLLKIYTILKDSLALRRFPSFCAAIVGGYTFLQLPLRLLYDYACQGLLRKNINIVNIRNARYMVSRLLAATVSAWFSLQLLNAPKGTKVQRSRTGEDKYDGKGQLPEIASQPKTSVIIKLADIHETAPFFAGKTIDLTILAVARAIDTIIVNLWRHSRIPSENMLPNRFISSAISRHADSLVFAISSGTVMWAWVYFPTRLPRAYNKWIGEAAQIDSRLIETLREARAGRFVYGQGTGLAPVLQGMCKEYDWPLAWGEPGTTIPIPCEVVHMGTGPSCHWHAAVRFARAFKFALATYLPLQLLVKARTPSVRAFRRACEEAVRSSAFLGAFVGFFYYGVCLSRSCLGPKLFRRETITPMMWDSGLCVRAGCILCGWSILIEAERRRHELAMFVAPRALATLLPRQYDTNVSLVTDSKRMEADGQSVFLERKGRFLVEYSCAFHISTRRSTEGERCFRTLVIYSIEVM